MSSRRLGSPPLTHADGSAAQWLDNFDSRMVEASQTLSLEKFLSMANERASEHGLVTGWGRPLRFAAQERAVSAVEYESQIASTGIIPTRDNRHDRYNSLIWLHFPKTKAAINQIQAEEIAQGQSALGLGRGRRRDAITLCDENLAVVTVPESDRREVHALFSGHQWDELFGRHRAKWHRQWRVWVFGHALLEKLDAPYKSLTAHLIVLNTANDGITDLDGPLSEHLGRLSEPSELLHLPLMGIPGWAAENEDPQFYWDSTVFRAPKRRG